MSEQQLPENADAGQQNVRNWCMFLHFSLLTGFVIPLAGLVAPIVVWQIKKADMPEIDAHGKVVVNWLISAFIYAVICVVLSVIVIGIPLMFVLGVLTIIFPIIGGIKANEGQLWKYPLSIEFLK
jgi:uncharacterized Tic20 family protein